MAGGKQEKEIASLCENLTSLPVNMRLFSLSMRSLYTDKAVGTQSSTAQRFRKLRDATRNDGVAYLKNVVPMVTMCVSDIQDYFDYYDALSMDEWWESLEDVIEETKAHKETCNVLVKIHEEMLVTLKQRQDTATVLVSEMTDLAAEYEKKVKQLESSASTKRGWAIGLAFVPYVNLVATPLLSISAGNDLAESVAKQKESEIQYAVAKVVSDTLVPALTEFIGGLHKVAGFFSIVHQELTSFQKRGEKAKEADGPKKVHYKLMSSKAKEIKNGCRGFYAVLPEIRTDFEAIPVEGTDSNYVDRWLEKQKKIIRESFSVKALAAKMINSITSSDASPQKAIEAKKKH